MERITNKTFCISQEREDRKEREERVERE